MQTQKYGAVHIGLPVRQVSMADEPEVGWHRMAV